MGKNPKNKASFQNKVYRKIHWFIFSKIKPGKWINIFYASYRHRNKRPCQEADRQSVYITQIPNEGAGIGHQIANYNGGLHYAMLFGIPYAYPGFKNKEWDKFLGFGENEISIADLKKDGYRIRKIPYFNESEESLSLIRQIIQSYAGEKVILSVELDQFYQRQYEVIPHIKKKFEEAKARKEDQLIYRKDRVSMAVHIRRGDIVEGQVSGNISLTKRWLTKEYFENIIKQVAAIIGDKLDIYLFSQGTNDDYRSFEQYGKVYYCFDMSDKDSFLHMVRADILVISKSSFSYKPALLADGIRICPPDFWHGYPEDEKWIVATEDGRINENSIDYISRMALQIPTQ